MHNIYIYTHRFRYPHPLKNHSSMSDIAHFRSPLDSEARFATDSPNPCDQVDIEDKVDRLERIIVTWHLLNGWFHQKSGDETAPQYDMFVYFHLK